MNLTLSFLTDHKGSVMNYRSLNHPNPEQTTRVSTTQSHEHPIDTWRIVPG